MTCLFADATQSFYEFYASNLRIGLFSGFLTLAGFLLTAMTLTVIQIKKELCEKGEYVKRIKAARASVKASNEERIKNGKKPRADVTYYGGLKRLGTLIWFTICCALLTSLCQLTIGILVESNWAAYACVAAAACTFVLLVIDLILVGGTVSDMFSHWEAEANKAEQPAADQQEG